MPCLCILYSEIKSEYKTPLKRVPEFTTPLVDSGGVLIVVIGRFLAMPMCAGRIVGASDLSRAFRTLRTVFWTARPL